LKYLKGDVFKNNNYCAISDAVAIIMCGYVYKKIGLKNTFLFALLCSLLGGVWIVYLEIDLKIKRQ